MAEIQTVEVTIGDSSDLWEFSSKDIPVLDINWTGSWTIAESIGETPVLQGNLTKNIDIFNEDSLINEPLRNSYKLFEPDDETVTFNDNVQDGSTVTVSGTVTKDGAAVPSKYIYIIVKGLFVPHSRTIRTQCDVNGEFSVQLNLDITLKTPADSFFIFQLMPTDSETLLEKTYYLTCEVKQDDAGTIKFRKELLQLKLKMIKQGVI